MAYKVIILYRLYMPSYVLGTFTEYPYKKNKRRIHPELPELWILRLFHIRKSCLKVT